MILLLVCVHINVFIMVYNVFIMRRCLCSVSVTHILSFSLLRDLCVTNASVVVYFTMAPQFVNPSLTVGESNRQGRIGYGYVIGSCHCVGQQQQVVVVVEGGGGLLASNVRGLRNLDC